MKLRKKYKMLFYSKIYVIPVSFDIIRMYSRKWENFLFYAQYFTILLHTKPSFNKKKCPALKDLQSVFPSLWSSLRKINSHALIMIWFIFCLWKYFSAGVLDMVCFIFCLCIYFSGAQIFSVSRYTYFERGLVRLTSKKIQWIILFLCLFVCWFVCCRANWNVILN